MTISNFENKKIVLINCYSFVKQYLFHECVDVDFNQKIVCRFIICIWFKFRKRHLNILLRISLSIYTHKMSTNKKIEQIFLFRIWFTMFWIKKSNKLYFKFVMIVMNEFWCYQYYSNQSSFQLSTFEYIEFNYFLRFN